MADGLAPCHHRYITAAGIALALPVVSCGLLFVGFRMADAQERVKRADQQTAEAEARLLVELDAAARRLAVGRLGCRMLLCRR